jgi:xanthine/uracil/vitamin C permease (AzgA family)
MSDDRQTALADFKRIMKWIVAIAALMVAAALAYLRAFGPLDVDMVISTTLGVFLSVVVGCGLMAAAFLSNKSGIDQQVTDSTRSERGRAQAKTLNRRKSS